MIRRLAVLGIVALALNTAANVSASAADVPNAMVEAYLRIQAALAGDSIKGVTAEAATIAQQAQPMGPAGQPIAAAAKRIGAATDVKAARAVFGDLSDAMIAAVNGTSAAKDVRMAYCPMAKKYWLQKGSQIENPYYGSEMLRCGEFKEFKK